MCYWGMCGKIKIYVGVLCYVNIELHSEILEYPKVNLKKKQTIIFPGYCPWRGKGFQIEGSTGKNE